MVIMITKCVCFSQEECNLRENSIGNAKVVDASDIKCIAKNSEKKNTVLYTFATWCKSCIEHLDTTIKIKDDYDVNLFVLLIEKESSYWVQDAIDLLYKKDPELQVLVLKDTYSKRISKKYKLFLNEITPKRFENYRGMSKYIILNQKGEVELVTNWKDWRDNSDMIEELISPFLNKKNKTSIID